MTDVSARLLSGLAAASMIAVPPAAAQTAEEAMTRYRATFQSPERIDCPEGTDDDIVVCGRRDEQSKERLPLPLEPVRGARLAGEPISAVEASKGGSERCSTTGPNQQCSSGFPVFAVIGLLYRVAKKVADPESE